MLNMSTSDELGYGEIDSHREIDKPKTTRNASYNNLFQQNKHSQSTYYQKNKRLMDDTIMNAYGDTIINNKSQSFIQ